MKKLLNGAIAVVSFIARKIWARPFQLLNRVTGKDNFTLASLLFGVGSGMFLFHDVIRLLASKSYMAKFGYVLLALIWLTWGGKWFPDEMRKARKRLLANPDMIPYPKSEVTRYMMWRLLWVQVSLYCIAIRDIGGFIEYALIAGGYYAATDLLPPRTNLARDLLNAAKRGVENVRSWRPMPAPVPIPVRA